MNDPAADTEPAALRQWVGRLRSKLPAPWSAATILRTSAPSRYLDNPMSVWAERPLRLSACSLPESSLNPVDRRVPLHSRLRVLYQRQLPHDVRYPIAADWYQLAGQPAILDRFAREPGGPLAGFALTTTMSEQFGVAVFGYAPTTRRALFDIGVPLASVASADPSGRSVLRWATPDRWNRTEDLQLTTENLQAFVHLEPLSPDSTVEDWTREVFGHAPFLRDRKDHGDRGVSIAGIADAHLWRFDWQPSGMGRLLTTVVTGTVDGDGFSFTLEVPLEMSYDHVLLADPDEILAGVSVV